MPRKPFDHRILALIQRATHQHKPVPSLEPLPDGLVIKEDQPWAWCDVITTVTYSGLTTEDVVKGQHAASEREWLKTPAATATLYRALDRMLGMLDRVAEAQADLGPRDLKEIA